MERQRGGNITRPSILRLADLQAELEQEIARVQGELDPAAVALTSIEVKPRKTDTVVSEVALVWQAV